MQERANEREVLAEQLQQHPEVALLMAIFGGLIMAIFVGSAVMWILTIGRVQRGEPVLRVEPWTPGLGIKRVPSFLHDPYLDHHPELVLRDCRVPDANRVPASGNEGAARMLREARLAAGIKSDHVARVIDVT